MKDAALRFAGAIETELIQTRSDQMELGQDLTEKVNRLREEVKGVKAELRDFKEAQASHNEAVMQVLIDIQRKLSA